VVICGDRFEQLAIAMAAAYLNKTIAHIEGGDVSGSIDESVRHAITKLAHFHFVTNEDAERRVLAMGEDPKYVFNTGSLDVEVASELEAAITNETINRYGVGHEVDVTRPFLMVIQHPVTTERQNRRHVEETLKAVTALAMPTIWIWPNPGRRYRRSGGSAAQFPRERRHQADTMRFITDLPVNEFIALLKGTACLIGNSSAGIKECSFLGTPVVNIGMRQQGRLHADNVDPCGRRERLDSRRRAETAGARSLPAVSDLPQARREPDDRRPARDARPLYPETVLRQCRDPSRASGSFRAASRDDREDLMTDSTHISIGGRQIGEGRPCFVIAEAGINHNGDTALAAELVDAAAAAGADAIKFQTHFPEHEMLRGGATAAYVGESLFDLLTRTALSRDAHFELRNRARDKGICFCRRRFRARRPTFSKRSGCRRTRPDPASSRICRCNDTSPARGGR
jgi:hypothetical protein